MVSIHGAESKPPRKQPSWRQILWRWQMRFARFSLLFICNRSYLSWTHIMFLPTSHPAIRPRLAFALLLCLLAPHFLRARQTNQDQQPPENTSSVDPDPAPVIFPHPESDRIWLSGQANFISQWHPPFHSSYQGPNSLSQNYERALSRVLTFYTGVRLNASTEVLVDVEEAGGSALSTGLGLAGNTDLDIVRNPLLSKAPYLARAMVHKVFALSKDKIVNQRGWLSLFDELPRRRLEIRVGKFTMPDFLDLNSVGSDTHFQFMNWTVDNSGAWDYAADTRGYTVGVMADYEDRNWGFRFAEGLMPKVANGIDLVWRPWQAHAENWEYELRHGVISVSARPRFNTRHHPPSLAHHPQVWLQS
jgi:high affinity Mn2+ porin